MPPHAALRTGLERLGLLQQLERQEPGLRLSTLAEEQFMPACCQGAVGIVCRERDEHMSRCHMWPAMH
jgi:porphobilinogen deaminase